MIVCKNSDTWATFEKFSYKPFLISGESFPYCPICGVSPYDEDYEELHMIMENSNEETLIRN